MPANNPNPNPLSGQIANLSSATTQGFNALQGQNAQILDSVSTTHRFRIFWTIILCIAALLIGLIPAFALGEAYVKDRHQATVEDTGLWVVHGDSMIAPPAIDQSSKYYWRGCQKEERAKYLAIVIGIDVTVGLAGALIGVCIDNASSNRRRRRNQNNQNPNPNNPNP